MLPLIIPILSKGLNDANPSRRQVSLSTLWAIVLDLLLKILSLLLPAQFKLFSFVFELAISFFFSSSSKFLVFPCKNFTFNALWMRTYKITNRCMYTFLFRINSSVLHLVCDAALLTLALGNLNSPQTLSSLVWA